MTGFVCEDCGWIYIQGGRSGRKACPKCHSLALRRYPCESLDHLARTLILTETQHDDPIGNEVLIRRRFVEAYERFMRRLDDWKFAKGIAQDISGGDTPRGLVANVYRDLKTKPPVERRRKVTSAPESKGVQSRRTSTLEELEVERREAERAKVLRMKKGTVRKKLL